MKSITNNGNKQNRGINLVFGITASGWYASRASFGEYKITPQHEHDCTKRTHYDLLVAPCVPNGIFQFYLPDGIPMNLGLHEGKEITISPSTYTRWNNNQKWYYQEIKELNIKKGWIFIDGKDVFENTEKIINELKMKHKASRSVIFEELSRSVTKKYGEEVVKLVLQKKGSVLSILKMLNEGETEQLEFADMKKIFSVSSDASIIANLMICIKYRISVFKATKVVEKAFAWEYLYNNFPEIVFIGRFSEAMMALKLYCDNWGIKKNTIGDLMEYKGIKL